MPVTQIPKNTRNTGLSFCFLLSMIYKSMLIRVSLFYSCGSFPGWPIGWRRGIRAAASSCLRQAAVKLILVNLFIIFQCRKKTWAISTPCIYLYFFFCSILNFCMSYHRMKLDLQSLFGLQVYSCTHWVKPRNPSHPPPHSPAFGVI